MTDVVVLVVIAGVEAQVVCTTNELDGGSETTVTRGVTLPQPTEVVVQVATAGVATATEFAMLLPANGVLGVCLTLGIIKLSCKLLINNEGGTTGLTTTVDWAFFPTLADLAAQ